MSFFVEALLTESEVRQMLDADPKIIPWTNEAKARVDFVLECYKAHANLSGFRFSQTNKDEIESDYKFAAMAGKNIIFEISFQLKADSVADADNFSA